MFDGAYFLTVLPIALIVLLLVAIFFLGYVKASPDTAVIISGLRKTPKVLIGKAGVKIPFLERKDELNLQLIPIDVKTSNAVPTADYININVDATVNVKISDNEERLKLAAQNFLNKNSEYIGRVAREVLEGNVREIVGKMALEEMVSDRQKFALLVKENAEPDLAAMGLDIISFNVQNFVDGNGVIENLGVDNIVKIQKNAAISRAESEKEIAKAQANAKREANEAEVNAESEIAKKQNELAIQRAELKRESDIKKAEADAAYKIQEEEQRKTVEITTANANIAKQEKEILLKQREAEVMEQALDAQVKKKAEAEAKKFAMEQEAAGIRTKGIAEAEAIRAKAVAEAEGIEKKAEAMAKMGEAAVLEMYFQALPEVVKNAATPLSNVDRITMYGDGNSSKLMKDIMGTVVQVTDGLKESTGVDLQAVLAGFLGGKVASANTSGSTNNNTNSDNQDIV